MLEEVDGRLVSRPSWGPRVVTRAGCRAGLWLVPTPEGPGALEIAGEGGPGRANGDCKGLRVLRRGLCAGEGPGAEPRPSSEVGAPQWSVHIACWCPRRLAFSGRGAGL